MLSLQWPFKWQPLKIYTAELGCGCLSISIISYSSCCSAVVELSPRRTPSSPTSFSSLYSWKRLDCSSSAVWQMFLFRIGNGHAKYSVYLSYSCRCVSKFLSCDADIRQNQTDGSNYCCQSHQGPLRRRQRAGRLKCQGDVLLITFLSAWLCPDIKPNVLPVTLGQAMSLRIYHRTLRPGIIQARGRGSPASWMW